MVMETWWRISGKRWTFAIVEIDGIVSETAPISKWAIGKPIKTALDWWKKKGADSIVKLV